MEQLKVCIFKANADNVEKALGDVSLDKFCLIFALAKFDMKVDVNLRLVTVASRPLTIPSELYPGL